MGRDREKLANRPEAAVSLDSALLDDVGAAFATAAERASAALDATAADAGIEVRFGLALRAVLDTTAADPDRARLCLVEAPGLGAAAVARKEAGLQRFVELLDRELAAHNGGPPPPLVAEMVVGGIYEVMQRHARAEGPATLPRLADDLRDLWLPVLRSH